MQNTLFESPLGAYNLSRPGANNIPALQAWDAADHYLISQAKESPELQSIAVFNDQFGALGVCLNQQTSLWVSDSYCAHKALIGNLKDNDLCESFPLLNPLEKLPNSEDIDAAFIKLPKNLSYLTHLLKKCADSKINNIFIAGMMKHLPKNILPFLQKYGNVQRLPFIKKATIYHLTIEHQIHSPYPKQLTVDGIDLTTHANVFGRDKLDPGAAFILENMAALPKSKTAADLCSGSGILGIQYGKHNPETNMFFYDESYMAVQSSQDSCKANNISNFTCTWDDGLKSSNQKFDLIICNPPFHEQHTVGDHIAKRLFSDAKHHMNKQGNLVIIGNRHLGYHVSLKKFFKNVTTIASNSKFVILKAHD